MLLLTREVRFAVNDGVEAPAAVQGAGGRNGYAGRPALRGLGRWYQMRVTCRGETDPATGYFLDIKAVDAAARSTAIPVIARACRETPESDAAPVMRGFMPALNDALGGRLHAARWFLTPFLSVEMRADDMSTAILRQRFEFAASHRLHVASLSDEENRRMFGKCNHPGGHGHNYVVEPAVRVPVDGGFTLAEFERVVDDLVIERFDHTHLNNDAEEFGDGALNPSVENIAKVCFDLLETPLRELGATLDTVTVWETEKTSATYPAR